MGPQAWPAGSGWMDAVRRRLAPLIRAGQEVGKWWDGVRGLEAWDGSGSHLRESGDAPLKQALRLPAPFEHLSERPALTPGESGRLLQVADRLLAGEWTLFGRVVPLHGSVDWSVHPVTGTATPRRHWSTIRYMSGEAGGDPKFVWELNRHTCLLRLAQAYRLTADERYAEAMLRLLRSWMAQERPGVGINWTSSLEVAIRSVNWCWSWMLTRTSPGWTESVLRQFLWQLSHHARHVYRFDSVHHSPNTHLLGEAVGLMYVGRVFPVLRRSDEWLRRGRAILASEFRHQILPDGFHFERSTGYHRYALEAYLHACLLERASGDPGAPSDGLEALGRIAAAAEKLRRPDGRWPVIGDEDGGRIVHLATSAAEDMGSLLDVVRRLQAGGGTGRTGRPLPGEESKWLLGARAPSASDGSGPPVGEGGGAPRVRSAELPHAGFSVGRARAGDGEWYCLVSTGSAPDADASGHAHADLGHVEIARGEVPVVVDPGSPTYTASVGVRNRYRTEQAHACLEVEGSPQAVPGSPFGWRELPPASSTRTRLAGDTWRCELAYRTGESDHLEHVRRIKLARDGVRVTDFITGVEPEDRLTLCWPVPYAGEEIRVLNDGIAFSGVRVKWKARGPRASVAASLEPASWSPSYGIERPGSVLRLRLSGRGRLVCRTVFRGEPTGSAA